MKFYVSLLFFIVLTFSLQAQNEDYIWLMGYESNDFDSTFGGTVIDFNYNPPEISYEYRDMDLSYSEASICSDKGDLLFYTDATILVNANHEMIENGDNLGPHNYNQSFSLDGVPMSQGALILPLPNHDSLYYMIHAELTDENIIDAPLSVQRLFYSVVDRHLNDGKGKVIEKNQLLVQDTLNLGKITASRHANGRDWWILVANFNSNVYHTLLLGPNGIEENFEQSLGKNIVSNLSGQSTFSPDGSKYARYGVRYIDVPGQIDIYDFDRCSGLLNNPMHFPIDTAADGLVYGVFGGLAFSPDSKLLYHSRHFRIEQFDLTQQDVLASRDTVAVYDEFEDPINSFGTRFGLAQIGPDQKIYIATPSNTRFMHIIHNPNAVGDACNVEQHGLELATFNDNTVPNYPNFRLRALSGSICDTLRPIASFSYDSLSSIVFTDESERNPTSWSWTFGDGAISTLQNPEHTYTQDGTYDVCLIASNEAGSDTTCMEIQILTTGTDNISKSQFQLYPNPTKTILHISLPNTEPRQWQLINALGQVVDQGIFNYSNEVLNVREITAGFYWLEIELLGTKQVLIK